MAATLIAPTDIIDVQFVPILIMGPPGSGKTTLAQTANNPLTLDFDTGIHRCANRKAAMRFDTWADCVEAGNRGEFHPYDTLVIDTGGRALDTMIPGILKEKAQNGYQGNLSPQGWGVLGSRFATWMKTVRAMAKDVVMVCHEEISKDAAGNPDVIPDMPGKMSLKEMHKIFDLIGRIRYEGRRRFLDFNPSEGAVICKNAAALEPMELVDLHKTPTFLADLLILAKQRIGKTSEASAEVARIVAEWQEWIGENWSDMEKVSDKLPELASVNPAAKTQIKHLLTLNAEKNGWEFKKGKNRYSLKETA